MGDNKNIIVSELHTVATVLRAEVAAVNPDYVKAIESRLEAIGRVALISDEDFDLATKEVKNIKAMEDKIRLAVELFMSGAEFAALEAAKQCQESLRSTRLLLSKKIKDEKEQQKAKMLEDALDRYIAGEREILYPSADHSVDMATLTRAIKGLRTNVAAELTAAVDRALAAQKKYSDEQEQILDGHHDRTVAKKAAELMESTGVSADRALLLATPAPAPEPEPVQSLPEAATPEPYVHTPVQSAPEQSAPEQSAPEQSAPEQSAPERLLDDGLPFASPKPYVVEISFRCLEGDQARRVARDIKAAVSHILGEDNMEVVLRHG